MGVSNAFYKLFILYISEWVGVSLEGLRLPLTTLLFLKSIIGYCWLLTVFKFIPVGLIT